MRPLTRQQRDGIMMMVQSGRGVEVYIIGEYLHHPVIEVIDYVNSRTDGRRHRLFRVAPDQRFWQVMLRQVEPIDTTLLPDGDKAFLNNWTKELI